MAIADTYFIYNLGERPLTSNLLKDDIKAQSCNGVLNLIKT
jgi:hypothetical protein